MKFYYEYEKKERKLKMHYDSVLLAELIYLNYKMNTKKYDETITGISIFKTLHDGVRYTQKDEKKIISNSIKYLKEKYNIELLDFNNLLLK